MALTLLSGFLLVASIQTAFLTVLCLDVFKADQAAAHELDLLRGSQDISRMIQSAYKVFEAADNARKSPDDASIALYQARFQETNSQADTLIHSFERLGLNKQPIIEIAQSFEKLHQAIDDMIPQLREHGEDNRLWKTLLIKTSDIYEDFNRELTDIHNVLSGVHKVEPILGIDPQLLLLAGAGTNILVTVVLLILLNKGITAPLSRLNSNCQSIMVGEPIPAPKKVSNEIGSLEQSFHEMSLVISENEKRRHSFLEFFQSVQTASLQHVQSLFEQLLSHGNLTDRAKRNIEKARTNIKTLLQLLESMTDALRFNTGTAVKPQLANCELDTLTNTATSAIDALLTKRRITFNLETKNFNLVCDGQLIGRVLVNFLSNAIKYSPEGGTVTLRTQPQSQSKGKSDIVRFNIIDQGPGISAENQAKLFQEFVQVESADGVKRSGTGLGLVICRQIIEAHGGQVGIDSAVGKGSCFWFTLPLSGPSAAQTNNETKQKQAVEKKESKSKPQGLQMAFTVLILVFLLAQAVTVYRLDTLFSEASKRGASFNLEKEFLVRTEETLGTYLSFKANVAKAAEAQDVKLLGEYGQLLEEPIVHCNWMLERFPPDSRSAFLLKRLRKGLRGLLVFENYLQKNKDHINIAALPPLVKKAREILKETEACLFECLQIQETGIENAYQFSAQLRSEIMIALSAAAVVNTVLLIVLGVLGLRITERIGDLKHKAEDFASGHRLELTITGKDELAYLDQRLCEVSQAIRDAEEQRQKLLAVINHDLRTPLSSIINGLQMILASGYGAIGERETQLTTAAETELNHLLEQINDLLLIEKIDAGLYQLSSERFQLVPLLASAAKNLGNTAAEKGVRVVPALANGSRETCVEGDQTLVQREFVILLTNAVQAAPAGSVVEVTVACEEGVCSVSVRDRGRGIKDELMPQIFERFRFVGGKPVTGLGLPLAKRLSAIHGGELAVRSTSTGTEARMTLPVAA